MQEKREVLEKSITIFHPFPVCRCGESDVQTLASNVDRSDGQLSLSIRHLLDVRGPVDAPQCRRIVIQLGMDVLHLQTLPVERYSRSIRNSTSRSEVDMIYIRHLLAFSYF